MVLTCRWNAYDWEVPRERTKRVTRKIRTTRSTRMHSTTMATLVSYSPPAVMSHPTSMGTTVSQSSRDTSEKNHRSESCAM